jgi:hypothetical protein
VLSKRQAKDTLQFKLKTSVPALVLNEDREEKNRIERRLKTMEKKPKFVFTGRNCHYFVWQVLFVRQT